MHLTQNFTLSTLIGVVGFLSVASGLKCYMCFGGGYNAFPIPIPGLPPFLFHEHCGGGGKLPDSYLVECGDGNIIPILPTSITNITGVVEDPDTPSAKQSWKTVCGKITGSINNNDLHLKGCALASANAKDECREGNFLGVVTGRNCICQKDKCNGGVGIKGSFLLTGVVGLVLLTIKNNMC